MKLKKVLLQMALNSTLVHTKCLCTFYIHITFEWNLGFIAGCRVAVASEVRYSCGGAGISKVTVPLPGTQCGVCIPPPRPGSCLLVQAASKIGVCASALTSSVMFHTTISSKVPDHTSTATLADRFMAVVYFINLLSWLNAIIQASPPLCSTRPFSILLCPMHCSSLMPSNRNTTYPSRWVR